MDCKRKGPYVPMTSGFKFQPMHSTTTLNLKHTKMHSFTDPVRYTVLGDEGLRPLLFITVQVWPTNVVRI